MTFASHTVQLGSGRSLHLHLNDGASDAGAAPGALLIHGALATSHDWLSGPAEALAQGGPIAVVDRPGHGSSRRPRFAAAPRRQAAQIRDGLRALGVQTPILVGHSFGALVALAFAEQWPEEVPALLLVGPIAYPEVRPLEHGWLGPRSAPIVGPLIAEAGRWTGDALMLRLAQRLMFAPDRPPPHWLATYPYGQALDPRQTVEEGEDAASLLPAAGQAVIDFRRIRAEVAIIAGEADLVADPRRHARRLHAVLPGSRLTLLPGVGHMAHHSEGGVIAAELDRLRAGCMAPRTGLGVAFRRGKVGLAS
ncbi:alpha/beta hydrolase [Phenylobacterium sp.]|jgi:pimeloyl-ACP methyl ester carboxylesterase|uniref:alpha/beta fold hydrolase n=1 Tax=Phenylobacterium sp. TaxID=1871053 RepID=UPI002E348D8C|nr:alpha/beta hydrolase [Phenylobacterium sp.]HEX2560029.1 alpha/beta hydrolase [Phenylobacterium sp.]